jgi:hypothetical protein
MSFVFENKDKCVHCNKIFGWIYDRRSHCRLCYHSVCKDCSVMVNPDDRETRMCKNRITCDKMRYVKLKRSSEFA